jgi:hypothetical protein
MYYCDYASVFCGCCVPDPMHDLPGLHPVSLRATSTITMKHSCSFTTTQPADGSAIHVPMLGIQQLHHMGHPRLAGTWDCPHGMTTRV